MQYIESHIKEAIEILSKLDRTVLLKIIDSISYIQKKGGRIFFLGVGGSAANCSHAVNDFRKILGIECYAPTDNVSELTARTNDEGWSTIFSEWLRVSRLNKNDTIFIFSVGGGNLEKNISPNLVDAINYAEKIGAGILGIVGRDGGYVAQKSKLCLIIPTVNKDNVTPHTEAFQAIIWHLIVSHPRLKIKQTKWESVK